MDFNEIVVPAVGSSVALMTGILVLAWRHRCTTHVRDLAALEPRVIVTGTRGKSSTVRLIHAALRGAGLRPYGRVTGTVTEEITPDGRTVTIDRTGQATVIELLGTVDRARRAHASTLVAECMAINPDLITLVQTTFVRGDIAVITNARADHLEEEGLDPVTTARTLARIGDGAFDVVTAEHDPEVAAAMREVLVGRVHHITDATQLVPPRDLSGVLPNEHPDNVATALAVTRRMSIPDEVAIEGMTHATHEPHDVEIAVHEVDGSRVRFVNLGSINDPESVQEPLRRALRSAPTHAAKVALLVNRWDRPFRSIEFAASLSPHTFDAALISGSTTWPARRALRHSGWDRQRIATLRWIDLRSPSALLQRVRGIAGNHADIVVIALENIDNRFAARLLHLLGTQPTPPARPANPRPAVPEPAEDAS